MSILSKKNEVEDYKKKMKQQIKEYLELRNNIRKFKVQSPKGDKPKKGLLRSKSERKTMNMILKPEKEEETKN